MLLARVLQNFISHLPISIDHPTFILRDRLKSDFKPVSFFRKCSLDKDYRDRKRLPEQIRMCARAVKGNNPDGLFLSIDQQPVRTDVAFPIIFVVASE